VKRICIFQNGDENNPLLLSDYKKEGNDVVSGFVVNGGWWYQVKNGVCYAKENLEDEEAVTVWTKSNNDIVVEVETKSNGYAIPINKAILELNIRKTFCD